MTDFMWDNFFRRNQNEKDLARVLQKNFLFQDLNALELHLVERIVNIRHYQPGEVVFRQGDVGVGMYIITKGVINIYVEEIIPETGAQKMTHITQLKQSEFFGDLALVENNGLRSASAVAQQECELISFFKSDLLEVTNRNPTAGVKILLRLSEILGTRLRQTTTRLSELNPKPTPTGGSR